MTTATEKRQDFQMAIDILNNHKSDLLEDGALLLISQELGKGATDYYRVTLAYQRNHQINLSHLTWAIGKALGFSLRDRNGYWYLAINGGGYSKPDSIQYALADFFGVDRYAFRYELA